MNIKLEEALFIIIIFQLLLLSFFLFTQDKGKRLSLMLMGFFFLALALNITDGFLLYKQFYFSYPTVALWGPALALTFGPLLYFYTKSFLFHDFKFSISLLAHLFPFFILELATLFGYGILSTDEKRAILQKIINHELPNSFNVSSIFIFFHFLFYVILSWHLVFEYKKIVNNKFSDALKTNVRELVGMLFFFLVLFILSVLGSLIHFTPFASGYYLLFTLTIILLFLFINRIVLVTLKNPHLFSAIEEKEISTSPFSSLKYGMSALDDEEKNVLKEKIYTHMIDHKPYLDPNLSLDQLADQLDIKPRLLSQVINESIGKTFFDFINHHRIEEAKQIFNNPPDPKITVLEVLYQVGFNSKSSFNTIFKKETGLTPSEYRLQQRSTSR